MGEFPELPPCLVELLHQSTEKKHWLQWQEEIDNFLKKGNLGAVS